MSNDPRRDESVERLLRTSMRDALPGPTTACVEAETLAAWADGALGPRERERVEAHVSSCANCQGLVAMFARSMPAEPAGSAAAAAPGFWTQWRWAWITAATTAAAVAVTLWIAMPRVGPAAPPVQTMASSDAIPEAAPLPTLPQAKPEARAATPPLSAVAGPAASPKAAPLEESQSLRRETAASLPAPAPPPPPSTSPSAAPIEASKEVKPMPAAIAQAFQPVDQRASGNIAGAARQAESASTPGRVVAAPTAPAGVSVMDAAPLVQAASGERNFTVRRDQAEVLPSAVVVMEVVPQSAGLTVGGRAGGGGRGGAAAPRVGGEVGNIAIQDSVSAISQGPPRWRIFADGRVERFTVAGATGQRVVFDPPAFITFGSAPTTLVCWLVGRSGVVMRTVDGQTFQRVSFPLTADLASIVASSASAATVRTAGGSAYVTADGGATWRLLTP